MAHAAALLGAAKILNAILNAKKDEIHGKVKIAFQQAEEIGAGARQFVQAKALSDVDFAFGIHVSSDIDCGKVVCKKGINSASYDIFTIHVKEESAHAASYHLGRDAAFVTANILTQLQNLVSQQRDPLIPVVISVGYIQAGTRYNVVGEGILKGTLRTMDPQIRKDMLKRIEHIAQLTAQINGCQITFENYDAAAL